LNGSRRFRWTVPVALALAVALLWQPARAHLRAASLLVRFENPGTHALVAAVGVHPVEIRADSVGETPARVYVPADADRPPGLVLLHGVHYKGIDEPRLVRFATTLAASGFEVLTPQIRELCDYRIDPASIVTIGEASRTLSDRLSGRRVGVMGLSFAGGLSLIAAADVRYRRFVALVVAVGAHDDIGRVLRFFASDEALRPDGTTLRLRAHDYGPAILVYSHAEDFFEATDVPVAREALRLWLHENLDAARAQASQLSPAGAQKMQHVFARDMHALAPELNGEIDRLQPSFAAVSPHVSLPGIHVPVFLLHGEGDSVIPSSETEWLAHDTPRSMLRDVLVSPAIEHVELKEPSLRDELGLVHFMSEVMDAEDSEGNRPQGVQE
jgi:acetyl esterase/lipase